MSERNNIDRLFQEKFKDFEVAPSDLVWENIQSRMNKKDKKTNLLPFWLKFCSFAAVFLIGFSVATTFIAGPFGFKELIKGEKATQRTAPGKTNESNPASATSVLPQTNSATTVALGPTPSSATESSEAVITEKTIVAGNSVSLAESTGKRKGQSTSHRQTTRKTTGTTLVMAAQTAVGISEKGNNPIALVGVSSKDASASKAIANTENQPQTDATNQTLVTKDLNNNGVASKNAPLASKTDSETANQEVVNSHEADLHYLNENQSKVAFETGHHYVPSKKSETAEISVARKAIADHAAQQRTAVPVVDRAESKSREVGVQSVQDSLTTEKVAAVEKTEKETPAEEEKDKKEAKEKGGKWVVSSSFSPVYMNLNGSGSALDSKFAENAKTYQTSMSYGVGVKYILNQKWSLRTGVNMLSMQYSTNDLTYYYSSNGAGLEHVNENGTGGGIVVENPDPKIIAYNDQGMVTTRFTGNMSHKLNYVEVPLEASYRIINKKFGVDVIGGVSSLFLNDNRVSLNSAEASTTIGEANNLNKIHFSTNVGLGLRYNIMKTLQANVEPMFKYQINTYKGDADNFKPYFFGIYTGVSFSF